MTSEADENSDVKKESGINKSNNNYLLKMKSLNSDGRILTREDVGLIPLE